MKKGNGYAAYFFINIIEKMSKFSDVKRNALPNCGENQPKHFIVDVRYQNMNLRPYPIFPL